MGNAIYHLLQCLRLYRTTVEIDEADYGAYCSAPSWIARVKYRWSVDSPLIVYPWRLSRVLQSLRTNSESCLVPTDRHRIVPCWFRLDLFRLPFLTTLPRDMLKSCGWEIS